MSQIKVTLPDQSIINSAQGATLYEIVGQIGKGLQKAAIAARVNERMADLSEIMEDDFKLTVYTFKDPEGREIYWHSTSHILAQAVKRLFPEAKYAIGPAISEGFYYDFDVKDNFTPDDLGKIEAEMQKIVKEGLEVTNEELGLGEAVALFEKNNEPYKVELLKDLDVSAVKIYRQGEFFDLCRGPHIINTSQIKSLKLLKNAGAYWRGNEKNKMLQRIYGISFPDQKELDNHLKFLDEAKERDHRKLGKELKLFEMSRSVGQGLILWTPKGGRIRTIIEDFWKKEHYRNGYEIVYSPHIGRSELWETSGHLTFYKDGMYSSMDIDGDDYYVKPMNCPFHVNLYQSQKRSYREFPLRWAELGTVYRYEKSGTLHGLLRVRGFTQDDAHLFCRIDQMTEEITGAFNFSLYMLKKFGFENFKIYLSTKPEKAVGSTRIWEKSEAALKEALDNSEMPYSIKKADGAFYGPKIDIAVKDAIGREWQLSTIQLDFNLPERFKLNYTGSDGEEHQPIMIHRALLGSLERFFGILIEHYKGAFPLWLAPVQVRLINVGEDEESAVLEFQKKLQAEDIRTEVDVRNETMGYKIRDAATEKIPFIGVIGKREIESNAVSVRKRGEQKSNIMQMSELIKHIKDNVKF